MGPSFRSGSSEIEAAVEFLQEAFQFSDEDHQMLCAKAREQVRLAWGFKRRWVV